MTLAFVDHTSPFVMQAAPEVVEKPGDSSLSKLKMLYMQAKELSESEVRYVITVMFLFSAFVVTVFL